MEYIYSNENSISKQLCNDIILLYENYSSYHYKGLTSGGYQPRVKDTIDFIIPTDNDMSKDWYKINNFLNKELHKNIKQYIVYINSLVNSTDNYNIKYDFIKSLNFVNNTAKFFQYDSLMIQKYLKNKGKYIFHDDSLIDFDKSRFRIFTFIWYLNDVIVGGETKFLNDYTIKPEAGKLVLFPACWTFPHTGKMPISNDKYIITGWIYVSANKYVINEVSKLIAPANK
jgi:hypothetical protein